MLLLAEALDDFDESFSGGKTLHDLRKKRCQPVLQHGVCGIADSYPYDCSRFVVECRKGSKVFVLGYDDVLMSAGEFKDGAIVERYARVIVDVNGIVSAFAQPTSEAWWEVGVHEKCHLVCAGMIVWSKYAAA